MGNIVLLLLWNFLHFVFSIWYLALGVVYVLESYVISSGLLKRYEDLNLEKLQYLAIVVDNEAAHQISRIAELLQWLAAIGVKNVCLYDNEGVLKRSKEEVLARLSVAQMLEEATKHVPLVEPRHLNLDFASYSDGKEAVARAANSLFVKHYLLGDQKEPILTESDVAEELKAVGSGGPDPDLVLVYGAARCHEGFPAWRMRYTEIVHMGPLKTMKYGSLVKAIWKFTTVRQNYGK
ncbi:uncharacterized protein LOC127800985 [Diospyros lotus]|uniref:uncharacterized protein LOC127800985 n=1 Tax=Diospyros lotus TaxID=55363 RepID=UPI002254178B|nr:uncharacterized protein LOC127800985 [Diospyros lotus]XP_052191673.1 uncharacterized protein LOC127800985 [Diospyros lotus]